jgi:hypothetical protein
MRLFMLDAGKKNRRVILLKGCETMIMLIISLFNNVNNKNHLQE